MNTRHYYDRSNYSDSLYILRPLLLIELGKLTVFDILVNYGSSALMQMYISLIKCNVQVGEPKSVCIKIVKNLI